MFGLLLLWFAGCKPPIQAPEATEDQMVFGFVHFEEPEFVEAIVEPLTAWAPEHLDQLTEGYEITALTADDVSTAGVEGAEASNILGVMGHAEYSVEPSLVAFGITYPDQTEINPKTQEFEVLEVQGDRDCFLRRECDAFEYDAREVVQVDLLKSATRTYHQQMRWLDVPEEDGPVLAVRQIGSTPIEFGLKGILNVKQQYGFTLVYPSDDGARRLEGFWIDAELLGGLNIPPILGVRQAAQAMSATADAFDVWIAENAP